MIEIDKAYSTTGENVYNFFQRPGIGLYIPLYQRKYSWDDENLEQLKDDLVKGVESLCHADTNPEEELRFLGTLITVDINSNRVEPKDEKALPTKIESIIDGQQRLSTISLIAAVLYREIDSLEKSLKSDEKYSSFVEVAASWKDKLIELVSLNLKRGNPNLKPIIIRGNQDQWTLNGKHDEFYISSVSNFLAKVIKSIVDKGEYPGIPDNSSRVGSNLKFIEKWLDQIQHAHNDEYAVKDFPDAWTIVEKIAPEYIYDYKRSDLEEIVKIKENKQKDTLNYKACSLIQLLAITHYLLERCCFTIIRPINDDWAFDMFQSLNATGTPLTALETFKPLVVNTSEIEEDTNFKKTESFKHFTKIESLFEETKTANKKSKLTQNLVTSLAITVNGEKLSSRFSAQRKWLENIYSIDLNTYEQKVSFVKYIGNYSTFYKDVWIDYIGESNLPINLIKKHPEAQLVSTLLLFLKDNNHKMAITTIAPFYHLYLDDRSEKNFNNLIEAIKITASFYLLWRGARSNSGLAERYRSFYDSSLNWRNKNGIQFTPTQLREYFIKIFQKENIWKKKNWVKKSSNYLSYKNGSNICRTLLFLYHHNTIPDPDNVGLNKVSTKAKDNFLTLEKVKSEDLKSIEHVAPQNGVKNGWDKELYDVDESFHKIGNLILMPLDLNKSAGNKNWREKLIYYKHLGEDDDDNLRDLQKEASDNGISLSSELIVKLTNTKFNSHLRSIANLDYTHNWNLEFVEKRTNRILSIAYTKLHEIFNGSTN